MRYHDYISQFTVIDETKAVIFSRMKQRARQLKAARAERAYQASAAVEPKKQNTFRLHPKRWIAIFVSAALVIAAIPTVYFTIPRKGVAPYSVSLDYMKSLMVETDGVTAYSIRQEIDASDAAPYAKSYSVSLLSATLFDNANGEQKGKDKDKNKDKKKDKAEEVVPSYYLYSTSEDYEYGNVEYDSKGIQKVTFKKNTETTEDVYDSEGNLIDSTRKISQEELDAQVNKIYTTKHYTYMQFVALVGSSGSYAYKDAAGNIQYEEVTVRPEGMIYDERGVAEFDKTDYFSSNLTASFVIDNFTGFIYKIENFYIKSFKNGLVVGSDGYYYSVSTDAEHNLVFTDVLPNKDAQVKNVVLDNYGWTFVANDVVDSVDPERKVIYTTDESYAYDSDRNVYIIVDDFFGLGSNINEPSLFTVFVDGEKQWFSNQGSIKGLTYLSTGTTGDVIGSYEDLTVYRIGSRSSPWFEGEVIAWKGPRMGSNEVGLYIKDGISGGMRWFDDNYDFVIRLHDTKLSYAPVNLANLTTGWTMVNAEDVFLSLSEETLHEEFNYYLSIGKDRYKINDVYYHSEANSTSYYHVIKTPTGLELAELTSKSYTDNVFIFQPINK